MGKRHLHRQPLPNSPRELTQRVEDIAATSTSMHIQDIRKLPIIRQLVLLQSGKVLLSSKLKSVSGQTAALGYLRGNLASKACKACMEFKGPFKE